MVRRKNKYRGNYIRKASKSVGIVLLPKIGWMRFFKSRDVVGTIKNATVSKKGEHWFVSLQTELEVKKPTHIATSAIGVDLRIKKFAALSDGRIYEAKNSLKSGKRV